MIILQIIVILSFITIFFSLPSKKRESSNETLNVEKVTEKEHPIQPVPENEKIQTTKISQITEVSKQEIETKIPRKRQQN
jgi:predicted secreted protein